MFSEIGSGVKGKASSMPEPRGQGWVNKPATTASNHGRPVQAGRRDKVECCVTLKGLQDEVGEDWKEVRKKAKMLITVGEIEDLELGRTCQDSAFSVSAPTALSLRPQRCNSPTTASRGLYGLFV